MYIHHIFFVHCLLMDLSYLGCYESCEYQIQVCRQYFCDRIRNEARSYSHLYSGYTGLHSGRRILRPSQNLLCVSMVWSSFEFIFLSHKEGKEK